MNTSPYGLLTRKIRSAWFGRVGPGSRIDGDRVQLLFNDMELYPTKSQVFDMLCCAGKCANRSHGPENGDANANNSYLTYGEFSLFAAEMKRAYEDSGNKPAIAPASKIAHKSDNLTPSPASSPSSSNSSDSTESHAIKCEVFLGGSCNPTTWRKDLAIPMLKAHNISYFNPQVSTWRPELMEIEHQAKCNADVLFFVIDNMTRGIAGMIEVAYLLGKNRKLILVISNLKSPGQQVISNEPISDLEHEDLTSGQLTLTSLVEKHGLPVFHDIHNALRCTAKIIRENIWPQDLTISDLAQPVKMGHLQLGNKLNNLKKIFDSLDASQSGEISISDIQMGFRILSAGRDLTKDQVMKCLEGIKRVDKEILHPPPSEDTNLSNSPTLPSENGHAETITLNFEQFCCIMSELLYYHYLNSDHTWSTHLATKTHKFVQSITLVLQRLLDYVPIPKQTGWMHLNNHKSESEPVNESLYDVYLGGSPSSDASDSWRSDLAIPLLKKHGLTYYNPESSHIPRELASVDPSIDKCSLLFFNITSTSRSLENMAMAAYYLRGCHVVLCINHLKDECQIGGEKLSKCAIKDYNRGRSYLSDIANRENVQVFEDLEEALQCVCEKSKMLKNNSPNNTTISS